MRSTIITIIIGICVVLTAGANLVAQEAEHIEQIDKENSAVKIGILGERIDRSSISTQGALQLKRVNTPLESVRNTHTMAGHKSQLIGKVFNPASSISNPTGILPSDGRGQPHRDDPFDNWIIYDDGEPVWLRLPENTWSRVTFTTEDVFTLQGISFMPYNPGANEDAPSQVMVYSEDQDSHDLEELLWEAEIEALEDWNTDDIDENWHFVEIPADEWIEFEEGDHFSILYGPAPGGAYDGLERFDIIEDFEDYDLDEPPSGEGWSSVEEGRSWVAVSDQEAHEGEQSVQFHDARDEEGDYCILQFTHDAVEFGKTAYWLHLADEGAFGFRAYSSDGEALEFLLQFNDDNQILTNDGDEYVMADGDWPADEWFLIEIEYDTDDDLFSAWLDGDQIVNGNDLFTGDPVEVLWWLCFSDAVMDDAYLDDLKVNLDTTQPYGWWNLYDDGTEVERSYVYEGEEFDSDHGEWEQLDGDLLIRANGEYPPQEPDIYLSSNRIDFGNVLVDRQRNRTFTISNRGREVLNVSNIRAEGEYFDVDFNRAFELEPNVNREITASFSPEEEGDFEGTITIESNDPDEDEISIDLTGSGVVENADELGVRMLGRIEGWENVNDVDIQDEYAFLAAGADGLIVVDISNPEAMEEIGSYDTPGEAMGVTVVGDYAYVADFRSGLRIIDITDPEHPDEVGAYDTPGRAHSVDVWGNYAYVADGPSGIRQINISNPDNPTESGYMDTAGDSRNVAISGEYGYVADYNNGVLRFWLMNERETAETGHLAYGVKARGDNVYIADGNAGILIFNERLSDERGSFNTGGMSLGLSVLGNYVFVADGAAGLRVLNVANFGDIAEIGFYDTPGEARRLVNDGNVVYLADGDNFAIYDCDRAINNVAPEWLDVPDRRIDFDEGDVVEFDLEAEDENDEELEIRMVSDNLPEEVEFTDNGDGTADFRWVTDFEDAGRYDMTFIVSDGDFEDEAEVELTVNNVNRPPAVFDLLEPADNAEVADYPTVRFTWEESLDADEADSVTYALLLAFAEEERWYFNLDNTSFEVNRDELSIDPNQETVLRWEVWAYDGTDSVRCDAPFSLTVAPLSASDFILHPSSFSLSLFPNPFNATTTISYGLAKAAPTRLALYDLSGREVRTLVEGNRQAGVHRAVLNAAEMPSGLYFVRMDAAEFRAAKKLMLIR